MLVEKAVGRLGHTGKCIRRFSGTHRPEVVDIGVNTLYKNMPYA